MKTKESSTVKKSGFDYNYTPPPTKPTWATKPPQTKYEDNNNQSEFLVWMKLLKASLSDTVH